MKLTAIVTGASEGLGKSFAFELASRAINLVLVALPNSGLPQLANFIRINFNIEVTEFELDLTQTENCETIFNTLQQQRITADFLINNAGLGNWSWFEEKQIDFYKKQIDLNITSTVLLTRLFLDQINKQQPSYILNVGSLGGRFVVPRKLVYGATKSFISYFTRCLQLEQVNSLVKVSLLSPGGINTKPELLVLNHALKGISKATILEPEQVAKKAIDGLLKGKKEIIPGQINRLLVFFDLLLPNFIKALIIKRKLTATVGTPRLVNA
ncbi:SDR family NAD(P)-dependent oxidoreductase [Pedobacter sp. KR3-3]|uniref:SDR family NAD(P)-dependent oxidoreductase n=1 Tax=Pedobacter albus TaxID=3113905 RepID=A0ABU7I5Z4_9SPHI|nr:SDR family NAD(P)-dependent oxidoreductase [Pedobacter sp. KR3-3]MEE1944751.1 SDR family NAD(P)-dependent oxidoreductase [Pedobacter sp. KR3-3]